MGFLRNHHAKAADKESPGFDELSYVLDNAPKFKHALKTCLDAGWDLRTYTTGQGGILDINVEKGEGPRKLGFHVSFNRSKEMPLYFSRNDQEAIGGGPNVPGPIFVSHKIHNLDEAAGPLMDYTFRHMPRFTELLIEERKSRLTKVIDHVKGAFSPLQ